MNVAAEYNNIKSNQAVINLMTDIKIMMRRLFQEHVSQAENKYRCQRSFNKCSHRSGDD